MRWTWASVSKNLSIRLIWNCQGVTQIKGQIIPSGKSFGYVPRSWPTFSHWSSSGDPQFQVDLQLRSPNSQFSPKKLKSSPKLPKKSAQRSSKLTKFLFRRPIFPFFSSDDPTFRHYFQFQERRVKSARHIPTKKKGQVSHCLWDKWYGSIDHRTPSLWSMMDPVTPVTPNS